MMDSLNIVFPSRGEVAVLSEPVPPLGATEVLIETKCSLVSTGTELKCLHRNYSPGTGWDAWVKSPFYPGYSNAGVVLRVGPGVTRFAPGDRVVSRSSHRQYVVLDQAWAYPAPAHVPFDEAAWFALSSIAQGGVRRAAPALGDDIVVLGAGLVGQLVVQYSRLMGARRIIVASKNRARLKIAGACGATHLLELASDEAAGPVTEITGGRMADIVYDAAGSDGILNDAAPLARRMGKVIVLGDSGHPERQRLNADFVLRGVQLLGSHDGHTPNDASEGNPWSRERTISFFFELVASKQLSVAPLITHHVAPATAGSAYRELAEARWHALGIIFDWRD